MNTTEPTTLSPEQPAKKRTWFARLRNLLRGRDRGHVAVTFLMTFPILLAVLGVITQYALEVNAQIMLNHAAAAAARSAITALPTDPDIETMDEAYTTDPDYAVDRIDQESGNQLMDGVDCVNRAARMQLESISPNALISPSDAGTSIAAALRSAGENLQPTYASRYTYAENATTVTWERVDAGGNPLSDATWQPADFAKAKGQRIKLTVTYQFYLNVPFPFAGIQRAIGTQNTIAGVKGYFKTLTSSCIVQLSPGREAVSDDNGFPQ